MEKEKEKKTLVGVIGLSGGIGACQACDDNGNLLDYGGYRSMGWGGEGMLVSGHVNMSETQILYSFNIFEIFNREVCNVYIQ